MTISSGSLRALTTIGAALVMLAIVTLGRRAEADEGAAAGDGAYGRLHGDVTLVGGVGVGTVLKSPRRLLEGELRARYLDAAGVVLAYEEAEALAAPDPGELRRAFMTGVEIRPLFPIRFLNDLETGRGYGDLVLDSIGLDIGVHWPIFAGSSVRRPGLALGIGVELPLGVYASGIWVRVAGGVRWSPLRLEGERDDGGVAGRSVVFTVGLAWHQVVGAHVVDAGDRRVR